MTNDLRANTQKEMAMTTEEKVALATGLIGRCAPRLQAIAKEIREQQYTVNKQTVDETRLQSAMWHLKKLADIFGEIPPDDHWFGDYCELTGQHMCLTDEGWVPPECLEGAEVLEEVNKPEVSQ